MNIIFEHKPAKIPAIKPEEPKSVDEKPVLKPKSRKPSTPVTKEEPKVKKVIKAELPAVKDNEKIIETVKVSPQPNNGNKPVIGRNMHPIKKKEPKVEEMPAQMTPIRMNRRKSSAPVKNEPVPPVVDKRKHAEDIAVNRITAATNGMIISSDNMEILINSLVSEMLKTFVTREEVLELVQKAIQRMVMEDVKPKE